MEKFITIVAGMLLLTLLLPRGIAAQQESPSDTLKTYRLDEVLIKAERLSDHSTASTQVISRDDIDRSSALSLGDVVAQTNGVFVNDYGATSGIKTISQRGLGSEQSVVLLNGMRITSSQNGLMDLGTFPLEEIQRVEILQGGLSSLVGADAVGGAVNILTLPNSFQNSFRATTSVGSFGEQTYRLAGAATLGGINLQASYGQQRARENFPYTYSGGGVSYDLVRANADIRGNYLTLQGLYTPSATDELRITGYRYVTDRGDAAYITSPIAVSYARQADEVDVGQILYHHLFSNTYSFHFNSQIHHEYERYLDPFYIIDNYFSNNEIRLEPSLLIVPERAYSITIGGEAVRSVGEGNSMISEIGRNQLAGYIVEKSSVILNSNMFNELYITPSIRFDALSEHKTAFSPGIEGVLSFQKFQMLSLEDIEPVVRVTISKNFRAPTFNELYWSGSGGIGNPNLQPEHAVNIDAGGGITFSAGGKHTLKATYYHISVTDRILWVDLGNFTAMPKNIRSVTSQGIEASYTWTSPNDFLSLQTNYTYGKTIKTSSEYPGDPTVNNDLPYVPRQMFNFALSLNQHYANSTLSQIGITISHQHIASRFEAEDNIDKLPEYGITSINAMGKVNIENTHLTAKFDVLNLFNEQYQVLLGYPMPGRSYRLSFAYELQ